MSMYPLELVAPMAEDLTDHGFNGLKTVQEVDAFVTEKPGTVLMVVNSVCGCAAAMARPGVKLAVQNDSKPDHLATVFAGVDVDATNRAREYMLPYPPSSPCIGLFKDGQLVHMLERHHIEGRSAEMIADNLRQAFDQHC